MRVIEYVDDTDDVGDRVVVVDADRLTDALLVWLASRVTDWLVDVVTVSLWEVVMESDGVIELSRVVVNDEDRVDVALELGLIVCESDMDKEAVTDDEFDRLGDGDSVGDEVALNDRLFLLSDSDCETDVCCD